MLYHSQEYGNTKTMADAVAEGLRAAGAQVTLHNTNEARLDIGRFAAFDCAAFGSPDYYSYIAGGLKVFLDDLHIAAMRDKKPGLTGKPYALFYSHGGGGKVRAPLEKLFQRVGNKVGETVESHGAPSAAVLEKCRALGVELAKAAVKPAS